MSDSQLTPVAFDIETSGFEEAAVITVAGFSHQLGTSLILNTDGRADVDQSRLENVLETHSSHPVTVTLVADEAALLEALTSFVTQRLDGDRHYLTAFNGETWSGGFDLPFCRTRYLRHGMEWPFGDVAYADMMQIVDRFDTNDTNDLVGVYDILVGEETCDPFEDSVEAVDAFEAGDWLPLLKHNLADIQRTRELADLAGRFIPKSDFSMKNLAPPDA
jgi:uncharacterized protein YprB with RNaseH-like and TPR domain